MVLLCFESRLVQLPLIAMRVQTLERRRADEAVLDKGVEESLVEGIDCWDFRHLEDPLGQIREIHLRQVIPRQEKDRCYLIVEGTPNKEAFFLGNSLYLSKYEYALFPIFFPSHMCFRLMVPT